MELPLQQPEPDRPVKGLGAIILAAGSASRMGQPKQLLQWHGQSLIWRAIQTALDSGCDPVVVVLGAHAARIEAELSGQAGIQITHNEQWETGMGGSIAKGMEKLLSIAPDINAVAILLVDQPLVTSELVQQLYRQLTTAQKALIAAEYAGKPGVPAIFTQPLFQELKALSGQTGAKPVIQKHRHEAAFFEFPEGAIDLDTPEEWERFSRDW